MAKLRLAVAGAEFDAEIEEIPFDDGPALVANMPPSALQRAHQLGEIPRVLRCPDGYRAVAVMLSEPGKSDAHPVRVPCTWELLKTEQGDRMNGCQL